MSLKLAKAKQQTNSRDLVTKDALPPHIIKYMGSKRNILSSLLVGIDQFSDFNKVCDLFAGTSVLSGALRDTYDIHSNDIQEYSAVLSKTYLSNVNRELGVAKINAIKVKAEEYISKIRNKNPELKFQYTSSMTLKEFNEVEIKQQKLVKDDFSDLKYHLFLKYYSGTYWSYEQCIWIDALRKVADDFKDSPIHNIILSSLMFAMSYNSQSTGHYAQYRDATNEKSKDDILIYRGKEIWPYFVRKFNELKNFLTPHNKNHKVTTLDYAECLELIDTDTLVYADPPYCFVHYSRFYHALETLVKYDYPKINFKGRYREDRHQSPFCRKTEVKKAFSILFDKVAVKEAQLLLSYSDNGLIELGEIFDLASEAFDNKSYRISEHRLSHLHSTMGRDDEKNIDVNEHLIFIRKSNHG